MNMNLQAARAKPSPKSRPQVLKTAIVLVLLAALSATTGLFLASGSGPGPNTVIVSASACAPGWTAPHSGERVFEVRNVSRDTVYGIDLVGANQLSVYGEIETLGPGTTVPMDVVLPPGRYSFECEAFTGAELESRVEQVTGPPVKGAHPYIPVSTAQIQDAEAVYRHSLLPVLSKLGRDTDALTTAVRGGDLALARRLWLTAHLDYARLGAAYDTFGDFNTKIDGRPLGLVGGVHSKKWSGFLRLEYGLWHHESASELTPVASALDVAVHGLAKKFPSMLMPLNDLALRTHEILENTLQFELTGETDEGSNTNLATAWANAQGTELSLKAIAPLLRQNAPGLLARIQPALTAVTAELKSYEHDGRWTALGSLTRTERERIDGSVGALLEQLSDVPDVLDIPIRPDSPND